MPTGQKYGTNVPQTQLTAGGVSAGATSCTVASSTSWPSTPFTAVFSIGNSDQEAVDVTNVVGTTWTIVRGLDGTSAATHAAGTTVTHVLIGRDPRDFRAHLDSAGPLDSQSMAVHGLTNTAGNAVVGVKETQTLTNKTLTSPTITGTGTIASGAITASDRISAAKTGAVSASGYVGSAGLLTPPTSGTFAVGDFSIDQAGGLYVATAAGTPGTWAGTMVQIATRTITSLVAAVTFNNIPAFNHLYLTWSARSATAATSDIMNLQINADSSTKYNSQQLKGLASATSAQAFAAQAACQVATISANSAPAAAFGTGFMALPYWSTSTNYQTMTSHGTAPTSATVLTAEEWANSYTGTGTARTRIDLTLNSGANFAGTTGPGCIFTLYGSM